MNNRKLLEQALNLLESEWPEGDEIAQPVIDAIRKALADHIPDATKMVAEHKCGGCAKKSADGWALYCVECWEKVEPVAVVGFGTQSWRNLVDALTRLPDGTKLYAEVANKTEEKPLLVQAWEKRFAEQAEQEPMAWMDLHKELGQLSWMGGDEGWDNAIHAVRKRLEELYAAPVDAKAIRAEALEEANDLLDKIESWAKAYPLSVFPEPDFAKAHKVLTENGMTLDAISASNMRHVLTQLQKMIDECAAAIRNLK